MGGVSGPAASLPILTDHEIQLKDQFTLVTMIKNTSGLSWDDDHGVNMPADDGVWAEFTEHHVRAKILGQKEFLLYESMSLLMPNKVTAKHAYHASNGFKDAGKAPDMTIPNAGEGRSGMVFNSGSGMGLDPGNSMMSMDPNWQWDMADSLFHMDLSREFGLNPGPSVAMPWLGSLGLMTTSDYSISILNSSSTPMTPAQSQNNVTGSTKHKTSTLDGLPSGVVLMDHVHKDLQELCNMICAATVMQVQGPSSGMSSQALFSAAPPGSGSPSKLTDQDVFRRAPPVTPQKKAMLGISKAECAAAASEFMQLNETWLNMDQLSMLCNYFLMSDAAIHMYLSLISPELRKTWLLKWLWDLGGNAAK
ncbi:hypothetical protein K439DRAFT_1610919 [Ramaria rubella]|nr:hypothetical protein K439DRAFT_1610919 [Ramaria rubella]